MILNILSQHGILHFLKFYSQFITNGIKTFHIVFFFIDKFSDLPTIVRHTNIKLLLVVNTNGLLCTFFFFF